MRCKSPSPSVPVLLAFCEAVPCHAYTLLHSVFSQKPEPGKVEGLEASRLSASLRIAGPPSRGMKRALQEG
jgi:hypothetical protein